MTDKLNRDARQRAAETGAPYTRARRAVQRRSVAAGTPATAKDVAGAERVPVPVALMLARHIRAAALHLSQCRSLAQRANALPPGSRPSWEEPSGPLAPIMLADAAALQALIELQRWAERTALASGAITALPDLFPSTEHDPAAEAARAVLYPRHHGDSGAWCALPGGHLPQPGERNELTAAAPRYSLPGPVPTWHLALSEGRDVRNAADVVPDTPGAPVWEAARALHLYACDWMLRRGDSPADLAATLDGLAELADQFASVALQAIGEIQRRMEAGTLVGVDQGRIWEAQTTLLGLLADRAADGGQRNHLRAPLHKARAALTGAAAHVLDRPPVPAKLAREMTGKTPSQIRKALGDEIFLQRQRGRTRPPNDDRADALEWILTVVHATGALTYDPGADATQH